MADDVISPGADAHVPAIDDDQGQPPADAQNAPNAQEGDASDPGDTDAQQDEGDEGAAAEVAGGGVADDPYYKEFIARTGLDPSDPAQLKTLKTLVDQKKYIDQLKAQAAGAAQADGLTPYEQELLKQKRELQQQPRQQEPSQHAADQGGAGYQDIGSEWKNADDAYRAYSEAWAEAAERNDYRRVNAIDQAIFRRRMDSMLPLFQQLVQQHLGRFENERLGEYLPVMREGMRANQLENAYSFALQQISKTKGYEDIAQLDAEDDGPPVVVDGEEYRPTAMNRILAENRWIMDIRVPDQDREVSDRLSYLARLRAAHKIFSGAKVNASKAEQLFDAGKTAATNQQKQKVRQSLNAGEGAKTALGANGKAKNFVADLLAETEDGPKSFASL